MGDGERGVDREGGGPFEEAAEGTGGARLQRCRMIPLGWGRSLGVGFVCWDQNEGCRYFWDAQGRF